MTKDKVFSKKLDSIESFEFNDEVTHVFDNMITRSVPFYHEIHRLILDVFQKISIQNERVYDLGCSTGTTIQLLHKSQIESKKKSTRPIFIGVDSSESMVKKCREKLSLEKNLNFELFQNKVQDIELKSSKLIIMNYTLQFIPVEKRPAIMKKIYNSLKKGGVFIMSEKIKSEFNNVEDLVTDLYYDFKRRNGYSNLEIMQKREALENVLVPSTIHQQKKLLRESGFTSYETIFQWYNFSSFIGIK